MKTNARSNRAVLGSRAREWGLVVFLALNLGESAFAQKLSLSPEKISQYCMGMSVGHLAVIFAVLSDRGDSLNLAQIRMLATGELMSNTALTEFSRLSGVGHINNFTQDHIDQLRAAFRREWQGTGQTAAALREVLMRQYKDLVARKKADCEAEIKASGLGP